MTSIIPPTPVRPVSWVARALRLPDLWSRILLLGACLAAWEAAVSVFAIPELLLPPPSRIGAALFSDLTSLRLLRHAGVTLTEVLGGFALGAGAGLALGCLLGRFDWLWRLSYPYVVAFETVPKVAIAPLIVVWFGFGVNSKIVTSALICFFPVVANTLSGLRTTPPELVEMMTTFKASTGQIFAKVRMPHAMPYVFAGLEIGIVMAVIGAIVGEFVGAQAGLGFMILQRQFAMDIAGVFSILAILSAFGIVLNVAIRRLQYTLVFWLPRSGHG
mgnify:CR=1 FL=1